MKTPNQLAQGKNKKSVGPIILISLTQQKIIDAMKALPSDKEREEVLAELTKKEKKDGGTENKEQYEKLKPAGFEHAPGSAKKKREGLKNTDYIEKMKWCQENVSYNADHTMNIIKLKKTFCEDISGTGQKCNWKDAKQLAKSKGYTLPTDYNDADEVKEQSDWYRVINIFSSGNGDTVEGMALFRDMTGCTNRYRTATKYKNEKREEIESTARGRELGGYCRRRLFGTEHHFCVCGFKDMK